MAVREISTGTGGTDTAVFSDVRANYTVTFRADGAVIVNHTGGTAVDGIDTLTNIERLRFSDQTISVVTPGAPVIGIAEPRNASALVRWTAPAGSAGGITSFNVEVVNAGTGHRLVHCGRPGRQRPSCSSPVWSTACRTSSGCRR